MPATDIQNFDHRGLIEASRRYSNSCLTNAVLDVISSVLMAVGVCYSPVAAWLGVSETMVLICTFGPVLLHLAWWLAVYRPRKREYDAFMKAVQVITEQSRSAS